MNRLITLLGALALTVSVSVTAIAFEGRYEIKGYAANSTEPYEGIAQIKKIGDTYAVLWQVKDTVFVGTGILTDDVLSVVFLPVNARAGPGLACLRIVENRVTGGPWTAIGSKIIGHEQWMLLPPEK